MDKVGGHCRGRTSGYEVMDTRLSPEERPGLETPYQQWWPGAARTPAQAQEGRALRVSMQWGSDSKVLVYESPQS